MYVADKMKPANVARLCMQCSDFYADAMKLLQLESLRPLWPKVRPCAVEDYGHCGPRFCAVGDTGPRSVLVQLETLA